MPDELILAIALVFVIEGGLYALFPEAMKNFAAKIDQIPSSSLRSGGLLAATLGVGIIWIIKS